MDVNLNATDMLLAVHHTAVINGVKMLQLDKGEVRNNRISGQGDFAIQLAGMMGEIAVSNVLGLPLRTDLTKGGDGGTDLQFKGQSIQVKTSTHASTSLQRMVIFNSVNDFGTDWAIACSIQGVCVVRIHGFISKRKFESKVFKHDFGYGDRYCVYEDALTDIERFQEALKTK
jgi:hypothetical protein